ncbi:MAG: hypothetical protein KF774_10275 [Planctomyces sp.]|nr:hypothetical protein [Planctomyces sp.]
MRLGILFVLACAAGCTPYGKTTAEDVEVVATVTSGGKPVSGVVLEFQPTADGLPKVVPLENGRFETTMTPGTYAWCVSPGKDKAAFEAIPAEYREASMERQLELPPPEGDLELKLD